MNDSYVSIWCIMTPMNKLPDGSNIEGPHELNHVTFKYELKATLAVNFWSTYIKM
jgi:hypothetical protein